MAFDQGTRGELQKFVTDIRKLPLDDFTRQLQQTYGMDPVSGEVAPLDSLKYLDDERLETAQILREVMNHYLATEAKNDTKLKFPFLNVLPVSRLYHSEPSCSIAHDGSARHPI